MSKNCPNDVKILFFMSNFTQIHPKIVNTPMAKCRTLKILVFLLKTTLTFLSFLERFSSKMDNLTYHLNEISGTKR